MGFEDMVLFKSNAYFSGNLSFKQVSLTTAEKEDLINFFIHFFPASWYFSVLWELRKIQIVHNFYCPKHFRPIY